MTCRAKYNIAHKNMQQHAPEHTKAYKGTYEQHFNEHNKNKITYTTHTNTKENDAQPNMQTRAIKDTQHTETHTVCI